MSYIVLNSPKSLQQLAAECMDKVVQFHPPRCWEWSETTVGDWIEFVLGLPYRKCFEVNYITGKKLISLEARHLPAMNVTDWNHIRHITANIRHLFHQDLDRYHRPVAEFWPPLLERYWRTRGDRNLPFVKLKFSDFLVEEGMLQPAAKPLCHVRPEPRQRGPDIKVARRVRHIAC